MFLFPQSSMVHVHVVSMLSGLLDHCVRVGEEAAEEGGTAPRTVAALVLQECAVLEQVLHRASGLCRQQLKGVLDQLVLMVHSAGLKCEEVAALEARTDGWLQHCTALLTAEQTQLASWTKLSSSETATHTPEPVLPSLIDPTDLLAVFDSIDGDGFGFAPRHDLLARVTQMSVDDSTLRFVVGSLEKMALKIVARDDFDAVVQQWKQLHSIMQDDDRDDSPEEESTASPPDSTADSTTGSPGGSPRSPGSILGMPGSPKGNHTAPVISTGNIDEVDERSPDKDKHSPNLSPAVSPAIDENSLSPAISPVPEIDWADKQSIDLQQLMHDHQDPPAAEQERALCAEELARELEGSSSESPEIENEGVESSSPESDENREEDLYEEPESPSEAVGEGPVSILEVGGQV
eukprot:TRINITY_DN7091_c0_g1_i3.p2 TRINITY_DN7091_c0_g1~~TRINITY_DN7091_c0_g1_i3.p2  ORF type:complete len:406 (+),score=150.41 TRINITY_DN7091_c0_g1_i3:119-1336(+)